ncbi:MULTISPECIES: GAF domain-containing sensor histidine kinase [Pseudonocardia]|uniref:Histidine kinase n=1 Tax=Pseudonocardia kunmingensis TaxID=630975 RepID=A0A543DVS4_9PSEU|nr:MULTISPECIES: GAF domain-containing protein [Pseudonocardia]OZM75454.1 histidine kinase [Pseudonocardia sp. MH-G8]TQM13389.1 histidine kinase [Pseudonocardia kunmingensis]
MSLPSGGETDAVLDELAVRHSELLVLQDDSVAMQAVARRLRELGGFDMSLVGRVEAGRRMVHRSWQGTQSTALHRLVVPEGIGLGGKSIALRKPVWVRDYLASTTISHEFDELVDREGLRAMLAVPMVYDGAVLGAVYVGVREKVSFGDGVIARVEQEAAGASISLVSSHRAKMRTDLTLDADRRRLAADLHDSVSPVLFRIGAELRSLRSVQDLDRIRGRLDEVERQVQSVNAALRTSLARLTEQPAERQLAVAIQEDCEAFEERTGIPARYVALAEIPELPPSRVEALTGVVREALVNVEKHARACTVVVSVVVTGNALTVAVADDGQGSQDGGTAPEKAGHLGLPLAARRMERVGGGLSVIGNEDGGVTVRAWVPQASEEATDD